MLIGSLVGTDQIRNIDSKAMNQVTDRVIHELTSNPKMDEHIRSHPGIMSHLTSVVKEELSRSGLEAKG